MKMHKPGYYLVLFATIFAFAVIILGAFTRLSDAGLGCPDWPGCYGFMWMPNTPEEVVQADELYPHAPFEHAKAWPEVVHRYLASTLGFLIILITVQAFRNRHKEGQALGHSLFLLVLVIAQGMFGMWTVTLKLWPQVVTGHLLGGFTTLSFLWLLCLRLSHRRWSRSGVTERQWNRLKTLAVVGLVLVCLQIMLGGWVSSNYAALACPDLPTCQNQWWPAMDFGSGFNVFQEIGPNYLGGQLDGEARVAIHMAHRLGAILVSLYLVYLIWQLQTRSGSAPARRLGLRIGVILFVQVSLGLSNILFSLPLVVAVGHNAIGALLLVTMVTLNYRLSRTSSGIF